MYQIIYLDIDGTLRDEQLGIPRSAALAIQLCRKQGYKVILCTGRTKSSITDDVLALPVDGIIAGGGCYLEYEGKIIRSTFFPYSESFEALNFLREHTHTAAIAAETDTGVYMNDLAAQILKKENRKKMVPTAEAEIKFLKKSPEKIQYLDSLSVFWGDDTLLQNLHVSKICLWASASIFEGLTQTLKKDYFSLAQQEPDRKFGSYYELIQKNCDKGNAVLKMCSYLGIEPENTIAFGDSGNDISMLKTAGCGIAMGNGCETLKKMADGICEPLLENGLYLEMKRRNLLLKMEA